MGDIDEIAIVGVGCRFPGADNLSEFWSVLVNGENHVKDIPKERWNINAFYDADPNKPGKTNVRKAGFVNRYGDTLNCNQISYTSNPDTFQTNGFVLIIRLLSSGPKVIKFFSCSTQLSMKFFLLINVKMPTIVGIFTFMSGKIAFYAYLSQQKPIF